MARTFLGNRVFIRNNLGARLAIDPSDFIGHAITFDGAYEPRTLARAIAIMNHGGIFVDIGCNFGLYAISVGRLNDVQCIAIDASYTALTNLHHNLLLNSGLNVKTVSGALSKEVDVCRFETPVPANQGTTRLANQEMPCRTSEVCADVAPIVNRTHRRSAIGEVPEFPTPFTESATSFWVAGTTLQQVLQRVAKPGIKLLKVDVEGHEMSVFKGFDWESDFRPENILVECDPAFGDSALDCYLFLKAKGYEAVTVEGAPIQDLASLPEHNAWFRV